MILSKNKSRNELIVIRVKNLTHDICSPKIYSFLYDRHFLYLFTDIKADGLCPEQKIFTSRKLSYLRQDIMRYLDYEKKLNAPQEVVLKLVHLLKPEDWRQLML